MGLMFLAKMCAIIFCTKIFPNNFVEHSGPLYLVVLYCTVLHGIQVYVVIRTYIE